MLRKAFSLASCVCILAFALLLGGCGEYAVTQAGAISFNDFIPTQATFGSMFGIREGHYYYEKLHDLPLDAPTGTALAQVSVTDGKETLLGFYGPTESGRGCITRDIQGRFYALSSATDYRLWALEGEQPGRIIAQETDGEDVAYYCNALNGKLYTTVTRYEDGGPLRSVVSVDIATGEKTTVFAERITDELKQHLYSTAFSGDSLYIYVADTRIEADRENTERYVLCFDETGKQTARYILPALTEEEKLVLGSDTGIHVEGNYLLRQCTEGMILYRMENGTLKEIESVQQAGMYLFDMLRFEGDGQAAYLAFWNRLSPEVWIFNTQTTAIRVIKVEGLSKECLTEANDGPRYFSQGGLISLSFYLPVGEGSPEYTTRSYICDISAYLK